MIDVIAEATKQAFQLRGSLFTLSVIQLQDPDLSAIDKQLKELVYQAPKFFRHAPVVIDLQQISDDSVALDFAALKSTIMSHDLILVGVRGGSKAQQEAAIKQQLAVLSSSKSEEPSLASKPKSQEAKEKASAKPAKTTNKAESEPLKPNSKIITSPVRSGQQVYAKGGDLIIIGSVSQGAELLADGSIHVYGPLRGRALAGINGDTTARIFCHSMDAELVSVAGRYIVNDTLINKNENTPQQVYLDDGKLKISLL